MKLKTRLFLLPCLIVLASCSSYKRNAFLEKGDNDGRFNFENGEYDKALDYLAEYNQKNDQKDYIFTDDRCEKIKVRVRDLMKWNYWSIEVKVNDIPMEFLLDTGAWWSSLSYDGVKLFGKNFDDVPAAQNESDWFVFFPKTFSFGNVCFSYPEFFSAQLNSRTGTYGNLGLGYLFYYFDSFTLDLKNKAIILNDDIPDVKGVKADTEYGQLVIPIEIGGKTYNAMLDTGNSVNFTFVDLWDEQIEKYEFKVNTYEGERNFLESQSKVNDIAVCEGVIEKLVFHLVHETDSDIYNGINDCGIDIILGPEFFLKARITVDTKNKLCYVVPNGK